MIRQRAGNYIKNDLKFNCSAYKIRFLVHHDNEESDVIPLVGEVLGENNYSRLTIPPDNWVAFQGIGMDKNMLSNIPNIEYDPSESINKSLSYFNVRSFDYNE